MNNMVLDRKTKDSDASIELLEDRIKQSKYDDSLFFIILWAAILLVAIIVFTQFTKLMTLEFDTHMMIYICSLVIICMVFLCALSIPMFMIAQDKTNDL